MGEAIVSCSARKIILMQYYEIFIAYIYVKFITEYPS